MFIAATNSVCVLCNIAYQAPYLYIVHFSAIEVLEIMPGDSELLWVTGFCTAMIFSKNVHANLNNTHQAYIKQLMWE